MNLKTKKYPAPWRVDAGSDVVVIRDREGLAVCGMPLAFDVKASGEQAALAELLALAPELYVTLHQMTDMVRRMNAEYCMSLEQGQPTDDECDAVLDDAQMLLDLLAEAGCTLGTTL